MTTAAANVIPDAPQVRAGNQTFNWVDVERVGVCGGPNYEVWIPDRPLCGRRG
jgi:hypothetical protein